MDESGMITESEQFLNEIERKGIDAGNLNDLDSFLEVYNYLSSNLEKLQEMREIMDESGYTAPYRSLNRYGSTNATNEVVYEDLTEINRYNQYFRMKASAKRNSLDRVKSAIAAHKIALGHLDEYAKIRCRECKKSYRASSFVERGMVCKCGCEDFEFKINHSGIHRLEIIQYLPLSGNYMVLMSGLSNWARESFKRILNLLKQKRRGVVKTVSPIIKVLENGRWIRKRVPLESEFADTYEEEVRRRYGKNVRIERLEFHRTKPTIVNDKHTRTALALAYARHAEEIVERHGHEYLEETFENLDKLEIYDEIKSSVRLETPEFIENEDDLEDYRQDRETMLLKEMGLVDDYGNLYHRLRKDLIKREDIYDKLFAEIAPTLILWDISKYYLCTSSDRRKRYGSPFPYIRTDIDRQQRRVFQNSHFKVVRFLKEKENEHILSVPEMDLLLYKKFKFERQIKNANIKLNYAALGPAIIYTNSDYSINEVSRAFKVGEKSVKREIDNIQSFQKPRSKKSRQFLDMIKN